MKTITMDYDEYRNDLRQAERKASFEMFKNLVKAIKDANEHNDDGSKFNALLDYMDIEEAMRLNEALRYYVKEYTSNDVPF